MIPTTGGNRYLKSDALSQADDIKPGACWEVTQWMASVSSLYFFTLIILIFLSSYSFLFCATLGTLHELSVGGENILFLS